jgi:tyrosinase
MDLSPAEDAWRSLFQGFAEPTARPSEPSLTAAAPTVQRPFSFFRADDQKAALALADEFDALAGRKAGGARQPAPTKRQLTAVMDRFHEAAADNVGLAQAALRSFIARWPHADVLPMPTLRQQLATLAREQPQGLERLTRAAAQVAGAASPEDALRYYRHDLDLSDHHLHWHALYPWSRPAKGMQGRLFLYMHQQMLARYNTERFAAGLAPVAPLVQWNKPQSWRAAFADKTLPADPIAPWVTAFWIKNKRVPASTYISFDEHGHSPAQNAPEDLQLVLDGLQRVHDGIAAGRYENYDAVGADLEASNRPANSNDAGPHNMGHGVLATPPNDPNHMFVMGVPEVAMTTPVFYRWHRAIDDFGFAWQESQGPDATKYKTPPVVQRRGAAPAATRSPDIILTPRSAIADIMKPGFDLDAWGEKTFGGPKFDAPADAALDMAELVTQLKNDPNVAGLEMLGIKTDWVYFLRMHNTSAADATVTVRIWLAALDLAKDRRNWIEMDKFVTAVPAGAKKVVARGGWQSTVVRRKSVDAPMTLAETKDEFQDAGTPTGETFWCECGLPYRLLLPRGTVAGMPARFLVLLTDAREDGTAALATPQCGSVLYCGKTDNTWPDKQEMGFPFHRLFAPADDPAFAHFDPMPNAAWRDVSIRCEVGD